MYMYLHSELIFLTLSTNICKFIHQVAPPALGLTSNLVQR